MKRQKLSGPVELTGNKVRRISELRHFLRLREDSRGTRDIVNHLVTSAYNLSRGAGWTDHEIKLLTSEFKGGRESGG
ncbi:MAG: hypothetical protein M1372_01465 [Patescibacteria group bacterium]|nr:hypothetical protein [Patescibacteria group bacterium]